MTSYKEFFGVLAGEPVEVFQTDGGLYIRFGDGSELHVSARGGKAYEFAQGVASHLNKSAVLIESGRFEVSPDGMGFAFE